MKMRLFQSPFNTPACLGDAIFYQFQISFFSFFLPRQQCDQMLEQKVAQMFPKVTQEAETAVLTYLRVRFFKIAQKVTNYLGYFC